MIFRKKPVEIKAVQLCWANWKELESLVGARVMQGSACHSHATEASDPCGEDAPYLRLEIETLEGTMTARHGDWIIKGVKGELYPCRPDIFAASYERADTTETADRAGLAVDYVKAADSQIRILKEEINRMREAGEVLAAQCEDDGDLQWACHEFRSGPKTPHGTT